MTESKPPPRPGGTPPVAEISDDLCRLLIEQSPDGIFISDAEGRYLEVNRAGAAMLGYTRDELLRMRIPDIHHPDEAPLLANVIARYAGGAVVTSEWRFRRKDGSEFIGEVVGRQLPDGRLQGYLRDISDRRRAEAARYEDALFHRQVLESIPGIVFTADGGGEVDYLNRQLTEFSGAPVADFLGDRWASLLHPDDSARVLQGWKKAIHANTDLEIEFRARRHDGVHQWVKAVCRPIRDAKGIVARWFGVVTNVDRIKRAEQALSEQRNLLRLITDHSDDRIFALDRDLRVMFVNPAAERSIREMGTPLARARPDHRGMNSTELFGDNPLGRQLRAADEQVLSSGTPLTSEETADTPEGRRYMLASRWPLRNSAGEISGLVGITRDITARQHAEAERLLGLARQRDTLMREVHHRVKNHLQGVLGLMRNAVVERPRLAEPMGDIIARMHAIVGVFGLQSLRPDARVRLCDLVRIAVEGTASPMALSCQLPRPGTEAILAPEEAVPAALIVNELLTNAVKHVRAGNGSVSVALAIDEDAARLSITNRPTSLPPDFDFAAGRGIGTGLQLVRSLMPSNHAELSYRQEGDALVTELCLIPPKVTLVGVGSPSSRSAAV